MTREEVIDIINKEELSGYNFFENTKSLSLRKKIGGLYMQLMRERVQLRGQKKILIKNLWH